MKNNADELSLEINSSAEIQSITSETIAITAGVAGVVVESQFGSFPIRNSQGGKLGGYGDTSISLTSTAFDTEVAYGTADADLANGEFWVDYLNGILRGKKKDASTSMTSDYKIVMLNISVDEIEVTASQNIEELGGNAIDLEDGAVDVGTQRMTLASDDPAVASLDLIDDAIYTDGAGTPSKGMLIMGNDGTNPQALSCNTDGELKVNLETSDIEIGAVELKNGTTDDRAIIKDGNTAAIADDALIVADPNVLASLTAVAIPTTLTGGEKTVTTGGTAEALGTTLATKTIYIRAKSTNTNDVFVGDSAVDKDTNKQIILSANDSITINIANRMTVYVDVTTNGEGVDYLVMS